jgi:hypothetical protein
VAAATMSVLALSLALSACSSPPTQEYEIPTSLCGTSVSPDVLKPLLPAGERVSFRATRSTGVRRCYVNVDGKEALAAAVEWYEQGSTLNYVAARTIGVEPGEKTTDDKRYLYSSTKAIGLVECVDPSKIDKDVDGDLFTSIRIEGGPATESEILALITDYTDAMAGSAACRGDIW